MIVVAASAVADRRGEDPAPRVDRQTIPAGPSPSLVAAIDAALERAAAGERLDRTDAETLLSATGDRLDRLIALAGATRDAGLAASGRPGVITYSRKVFVPLTTLCRDRCHYCVFVDTPGQLRKKHKPAYMTPEQVLAVVRQGQAMGCKEVLLTLGDRPEERWPEARAWLDEHGFASTIEYVAHIARLVTAETGMLAHANPGVLSAEEFRMLRPVAPSMGMMLETTSRRLFEEPGQVHYGSPDKDPAVRLRVLDDAGRERVPFTTGILVGIGETPRDRAESLVAIREAHERHAVGGEGPEAGGARGRRGEGGGAGREGGGAGREGGGATGAQGHVQEVIVQNFRAKPRTAMQAAPDAELLEYVAAVAVARLVMGPRMRIQVPPNLSDPAEFALLVCAGADDWGGVSPLTADHVNPERPWPHLDDLARRTAELGFELRERLTAQPEFVRDPETWIAPELRRPVAALADPGTGLAAAVAASAPAVPIVRVAPAVPAVPVAPVAPGASRGVSTHSTGSARPEDLDSVGTHRFDASAAGRASVRHLAEAAAADPAALDDREWVALLEATGDDLDALTETADDVRRYTVGEAVSLVINRNLTSSGLRTAPTGDPTTFTLEHAGAIAADAWDLGATEICVQGLLPASEDPAGYLEIARAIKAAAPRIHLHAYRPQDVRDLADRGGLGLDGALAALREAGVDTVPGTGVKVLSERVRGLVAPDDLDIDRWLEGITAAHRAGFRSTSVLFYGHVETTAERIAHLRRLRAIQDAATRPFESRTLPESGATTSKVRDSNASHRGGFTEFVPIPLPGPRGGVPLVSGRSDLDEHRAMVAVSRLLLSGSIPHVQIAWTRVGRAAASALLRAGGDDLGGTLLDGRVRPEAGTEFGQELPVTDAAAIAARLFRPFRQRTTDYLEPPADRKAPLR